MLFDQSPHPPREDHKSRFAGQPRRGRQDALESRSTGLVSKRLAESVVIAEQLLGFDAQVCLDIRSGQIQHAQIVGSHPADPSADLERRDGGALMPVPSREDARLDVPQVRCRSRQRRPAPPA